MTQFLKRTLLLISLLTFGVMATQIKASERGSGQLSIYLPLIFGQEPPPLTAVAITPYATGFYSITNITHAGDERLFVSEKAGRIHIIEEGTILYPPFLDITDKVTLSLEQGFLGLAFHPNYAQNGYFYVNYTDINYNTVVARYQVDAENPNLANPDSETILMNIIQPTWVHQAGALHFGPDGYLYIALGDGGEDFNATDPTSLLGKILRVDVDTGNDATPYLIPADNPYVGTDTMRDEVWLYGFRNPWRFSFDRQTGDMYIGDVGFHFWEEINFVPATHKGGGDYGWPCYESNRHRSWLKGCADEYPYIAPTYEYEHGPMCAVIGGYVYRGQNYPSMRGHYLWADYCTGTIWSLKQEANEWIAMQLGDFETLWSSFGEDINGEIYLGEFQGSTLYKLSPKE